MANKKEFLIGAGLAVGAVFATPALVGALAAYAKTAAFLSSAGAGLFAYGTGRVINSLKGTTREQIDRRVQGSQLNVRSTQAQIPVVYGKARVGMSLVDMRVISSADSLAPGTPTAFFADANNLDVLCKVGAFALGSENGSGIEAIDNIRVYSDGVNAITSSVTGLAGFGAAPSNAGVIEDYRPGGTGDGVLKYTLQAGTDAQTVETTLNDDALNWTQGGAVNVAGRGIAYGAFYFRYDEEIWTQGVPQITAEVTGNRVYDMRSSSWAWSDNPALCILDYLTSKRYGGGVPYAARDGGTLDFIDEQSFEDAANYCDAMVARPSPLAAEKRFVMNGVVPTNRVVGANVLEMLAACRGELVWQNGKYKLLIRSSVTPEAFELTEDNIVGQISWTRKGTSIPNQMEATFPNAASGDVVSDSVAYPASNDTTYITEDNGIENRAEIALPYVNSKYQAERIIITMLKELRQDVLVSLSATEAAYTLQVGDVVRVTHEGPGWTQKEFRVREVTLNLDATVGLALQEYDDSIYTLPVLAIEDAEPATNLPDQNRPNTTVRLAGDRFVSVGGTTSGGVAAQQWKRRVDLQVGSNTRALTFAYDFDRPGIPGGTPVTNLSRSYTVNVTPDTVVEHFLEDGAAAAQIFLARDDNGTTRYDEGVSVTITPNDTAGATGTSGVAITTGVRDLALEDDVGLRVDAEVEVIAANYAVTERDDWLDFTTSIAYFAQGFTMPSGDDQALASVEVYLKKTGTPAGDVNLYVYSNDTAPTPDAPDASVASATSSFTASGLSASGSAIRLDMDRVTLTAGGEYWVVVEHIDSSGTDYVQIAIDTSSPSGTLMTDTATSPEIVAWTVANSSVRQAAGFYVRRFGTQVVPVRQVVPDDTKSTKFTWLADGNLALSSTGGGGGGSTVSALSNLSDVSIISPSTDQFLKYSGALWVNSAINVADVTDLDDDFSTASIVPNVTIGSFQKSLLDLSEPAGDRIVFFDFDIVTGLGEYEFLTVGSGLSITGATITATAVAYGDGDGIAISGGNVISVDGTGGGAGLFSTAFAAGSVTPLATDGIIIGDGGLTGKAETVLISDLPFTNNTGDVESVTEATDGGLTVTSSGGPDVELALNADGLANFTPTDSMDATDRFVIHEAGQGTRKIAASKIPLSIFNDNLGFSQNVAGDGITLTTTSGTDDTINVAYSAASNNLIGAPDLLVGNSATTDRILVTEGGASAIVRQAELSQLPFPSKTGSETISGDWTITGDWGFTSEPGIAVTSGTGEMSLQQSGFHAASLIGTNLKYVSGGGTDNSPFDPANWEYTDVAGGSNNAGSAIVLKGNGSETGVRLEWYTAPTSTGVGANPLTLTKRLGVSYNIVDFNGAGDAQFQLNSTSATGNPYYAWSQNGNRRAYIQFHDTTDTLRIVVDDSNTDNYEVRIGTHVKSHLNSKGTTTGQWLYQNSQVAVEEQAEITATGDLAIDWDKGNSVGITNGGARTITLNDTLMQEGGHYNLIVRNITGVASDWAWTTSGVLHWQNGQEPIFGTLAGDYIVVTFIRTGSVVLGFWALAT